MTDGDRRWAWDEFVPVLSDSLALALGEPVEGLSPSSHLVDDIGLDSFGVLVLLDQLEAELQVSLPAFEDEPTAGRIFELVVKAGGTPMAPAAGA